MVCSNAAYSGLQAKTRTLVELFLRESRLSSGKPAGTRGALYSQIKNGTHVNDLFITLLYPRSLSNASPDGGEVKRIRLPSLNLRLLFEDSRSRPGPARVPFCFCTAEYRDV
jgi:hypothetical protein